MKTFRIEIPTNPSELAELAATIKAKNLSLGDASPVKNMDWATNSPKIDKASAADKQANSLRTQSEEAAGERNSLLPDVTEFVRGCRDILQGLNRSNPRVLGSWGFEVNDSV